MGTIFNEYYIRKLIEKNWKGVEFLLIIVKQFTEHFVEFFAALNFGE